jgi:integrase
MQGNLEQLGPDRWRLRVFAGRDGTGKPRVVRRNVRGTKRQATSALAKFVADVERGQVADNHPGSVADLLDRWLAEIAPLRSAYTMREHRRSVERDIKPAIGALRLDKLSPRHLDDLYGALLARGLSPASVRRHHCIVHAALDRAVRWGTIAANPADRASPPGPSRSRASAPTVRDVQRLIAAAEQHDPVMASAIALGAVTGARRGELCALHWSDIDWEKKTLLIERSLTVLHRVAMAGPTKTHARRDVAIDDMLGAFLAQRQADQQGYARKVGVALVGDPYLLSRSADGSAPCLPDGLTAGYARLAARLGINGHFHQLRHFAATVAIGSGADVRTVSGRLGHADPSVTLRVYAHAIQARDRELASILGTTVLGTVHRSPELDEADPPAPPELDSAG